MSYHILHQFDEQWLADLSGGDEGNSTKAFPGAAGTVDEPRRRIKLPARDGHRWVLVAAAVLMATFALLFAIDATQRAETLQQRIDAVEKQLSGIKGKSAKNLPVSD